MKKDEIVRIITQASGISKANINRFYDNLVELAKKQLSSDGEFTLPGLGILRVKEQQAREGRNPKTGEKIQVPKKKVVRFGAYKHLKEILNSSDPTEETGGETSES